MKSYSHQCQQIFRLYHLILMKKVMVTKDDEESTERIEPENSHVSNFDSDSILSPSIQSHSPQTIISTILNTLLTEIESNDNNPSLQVNSLPIIEDDQMEGEEDDEDDEEK